MRSIQLALHRDRFAGACAALAAWPDHPQDRLDKRPATCGLPGKPKRIKDIVEYIIEYIKHMAVRIGDVHQLERMGHADPATRKNAPAKMLPIEAGEMRHPKPPLSGPIGNLWIEASRSGFDLCQCRVVGLRLYNRQASTHDVSPLSKHDCVACWSVMAALAIPASLLLGGERVTVRFSGETADHSTLLSVAVG
jgi:hypothetical protein